MTEQVLLNGVSRSERHGVISSATEAVHECGGWVDDVHFFSNVAVNLRCVVPPAGVARLVEEFGRLPLGLGRDDMATLGRAAAKIGPDGELKFSLQITFVHDEPDMRRHVPSVPG